MSTTSQTYILTYVLVTYQLYFDKRIDNDSIERSTS